MTRISRFFCVLILLCPVSVGAAADVDTTSANARPIADPILIPANSTGVIDFAVDAAGFKGVNGQTYTELYLLLRPSQFTLVEQSKNVYQGKFQIEAVLFDETGNEVTRAVEQRLYETNQPVLISRRGEERVMMDVVPVSLKPGIYRAEVVIKDLNGKQEGKASKPFIVDAYESDQLSLSDIQFSTQVQQDTTENRFTKNGLLVLPNPTRIFEKWAEPAADGSYKPKIMYFYFEIYNFAAATDGGPSTYDILYSVKSHASGMTFPMPAQKGLTKPGTSGVKVLALDISSFPEDLYTLELTVRDNASGEAITRQCIFEVVQPPPPPPPVTVLTEEAAKRGLRMLKFMASNRDVSLYEKLDLKGKTEFLINFWKERDPTPGTPENEYMIVFNERFSFADYQLGGAESDRGRAFMKYGEPEEIERHDSDNNMKAFQIWYYTSGVNGDASRSDGGGRQFFVFGDRLGLGKYQLLHSSAVGEIYNPDWRSELLLRNDMLSSPQSLPVAGEKPGGEP